MRPLSCLNLPSQHGFGPPRPRSRSHAHSRAKGRPQVAPTPAQSYLSRTRSPLANTQPCVSASPSRPLQLSTRRSPRRPRTKTLCRVQTLASTGPTRKTDLRLQSLLRRDSHRVGSAVSPRFCLGRTTRTRQLRASPCRWDREAVARTRLHH